MRDYGTAIFENCAFTVPSGVRIWLPMVRLTPWPPEHNNRHQGDKPAPAYRLKPHFTPKKSRWRILTHFRSPKLISGGCVGLTVAELCGFDTPGAYLRHFKHVQNVNVKFPPSSLTFSQTQISIFVTAQIVHKGPKKKCAKLHTCVTICS